MIMKYSLILVIALCLSAACPTTSISRWFTSSYHDLRVTLRRFGHCVSGLSPLKNNNFNETDFLINQMKNFLDEANYDNEQLSNVTLLMDTICRFDLDTTYAISINIDVPKYSNNVTGKEARCRAIDEAMDSMYHVFRRASLNKSEPLDFSTIHFYKNATDKSGPYNLTDLINTSWIASEALLEHVCKITDSVKDYVRTHTSNSTAQDRIQQAQNNGGLIYTLRDFFNRILDSLLGTQKRLYWESNNRLELARTRLSSQLGNITEGFGNRYKSVKGYAVNMFSSASNSTVGFLNSTIAQANRTLATLPSRVIPALNSTINKTVLGNNVPMTTVNKTAAAIVPSVSPQQD